MSSDLSESKLFFVTKDRFWNVEAVVGLNLLTTDCRRFLVDGEDLLEGLFWSNKVFCLEIIPLLESSKSYFA